MLPVNALLSKLLWPMQELGLSPTLRSYMFAIESCLRASPPEHGYAKKCALLHLPARLACAGCVMAGIATAAAIARPNAPWLYLPVCQPARLSACLPGCVAASPIPHSACPGWLAGISNHGRLFEDVEAAGLAVHPAQKAEMGKLLMHAVRELAR